MIDAHLHLQDCISAGSVEKIIADLRSIGVTILSVNGTWPGDWEIVSDLSLAYKEVVPSFGVHPWNVKDLKPIWDDTLLEYLQQHPEAGVGEIGLDKWIEDYDLPTQKEVFSKQLELAAELQRPLSVHCLQAWGSLFECFEESSYKGGFLLHSYGGPVEMIEDWVRLGAFFSISGYFFREDKANKLSTFEKIPENRILLETDAPDMALSEKQVRYRAPGLKNHPANLEVVYERYGKWMGLKENEVEERMQNNFSSFREYRAFRS